MFTRCFLALLLLATPCFATGFTLKGIVLEKGTRTPLKGVNVYVRPIAPEAQASPAPLSVMKSVTDPKGEFQFEGVPAGEFEWIVNLSGYESYRSRGQLSEEKPLPYAKLYVEKMSYAAFETTIYGKSNRRDVSVKSMSAEEARTMPGAGGDPLKAVQNLPGMARSTFSTQAIIQGSAPKDTRYMVDGHSVPLSFHLLGVSAVLIPEAVDHVDYLSAGYGAEYGRAMGGQIGLWTRSPRNDRLHGLGYVDLFNAGAMVEGPIGEKSSFLISARRSYIDVLLGLVAQNNEDFDFTVAPNFQDASLLYRTELTPIDEVKVLGLGSLDMMEFLLKSPIRDSSSARGEFYYRNGFVRLIPQLTHKHSSITTSRWSFGVGREWLRNRFSTFDFYRRKDSLTSRVELERKLFDPWTGVWGVDHETSKDYVTVDYATPGDQVSDASFHSIGLYWKNFVDPSGTPWTLMPAARVDYFSSTDQFLPVPRLAVRYALTDTWSLRTAGGLYYQPPESEEIDSESGNPDLLAPSAWHYTLGTEKDLRIDSSTGVSVGVAGFYRYFRDLVISSTNYVTRDGVLEPERYSNDGKGRAFGAEAQVKATYLPFTGSIAYTLSRSTRTEPENGEHLFRYDQTHNLNILGAVDLPGNWRISSRLRFVTGNPYTPIVGAFYDADNDAYRPIDGGLFSARFSPFFQADIRIDKKWIVNEAIYSVYLDIQNVTNNGNEEFVTYSYNYKQRAAVTGLPILPTIGLRAEL